MLNVDAGTGLPLPILRRQILDILLPVVLVCASFRSGTVLNTASELVWPGPGVMRRPASRTLQVLLRDAVRLDGNLAFVPFPALPAAN